LEFSRSGDWIQVERMEKPEKEIAVFYCTHQGERVTQILKGLNGLEKLRVRKVALPCSGKLEVFQLTRALESGADGVALFGCPEGECRYVVGSSRAKGRVSYAGKILEMIGLEKERVKRFVLESRIQPETVEAISTWVGTVKALKTGPKASKSD
jgi:coenzyme F420-reducing hydrogenase delta subunit